jgi:hypothetical protein
MTLSALQLSGALPKNPRFREWCGAATETEAVDFIRRKCNIASRKQIGSEEIAARRFHQRVRLPFVAYLEQLGQPA